MVQAARVGAWKAVRRYRAGAGASIKTHAINMAKWEQLHYLRDYSAMIRIPWRAYGVVAPLKRIAIGDVDSCVPDAFSDSARAEALRRAQAVVSEKAWSAFVLMADGYTPSDVARMEGVCPATVHQRVRAARRLLAERGIGDEL